MATGGPPGAPFGAAVMQHSPALQNPSALQQYLDHVKPDSGLTDSVGRQFDRLYPPHARRDDAVRLIAAAVKQGRDRPETDVPEAMRPVHQAGQYMAEKFVPGLDAFPASAYPVDRPLTDAEQRAYAGYPGPGWTQREHGPKAAPFVTDGRWEMDPLAPGEKWEKQNTDDREAIRGAYHGTLRNWANMATNSRDLPDPIGDAGKSLWESISNTQHPVGNFFNDMSRMSQASRLWWQGESGSLADAWKDSGLAHGVTEKLRRTSPVYPNSSIPENATTADRIRAVQRLAQRKDALDPLAGSEHAILTTGKPQSVGRSLAQDVAHDLADPFTAATLLMGIVPAIGAMRAGAPAAKVIGHLANAVGSEALQEAFDNAKWTIPQAAAAISGEGLSAPDLSGRYPAGMTDEARAAEMERRERDRARARKGYRLDQ